MHTMVLAEARNFQQREGVARWSHKILLSRASNAFLIAKMLV
jgi:hypothetical protein